MRTQINATRVIDITPPKSLEEDACMKSLTLYEAHIIRKIVPRDPKEKATWAKAEVTKDPLSQEDIIKAVKRLNEGKRSVEDKKAALMPNQKGQVNRLLDELESSEPDRNFEWSIVQIDQKEFTNKKGHRETSSITVYLKRAPLKYLNPVRLFKAIERNKQQRLEQMNRPPPPEPQQGGGLSSNAGVTNLGKLRPCKPYKLRRPKKKYHDTSSVSSGLSSGTDSGSESGGSAGNTTISTHSARHSRRHSRRGRAQSLPRENRKKYYIDDRVLSPEPLRRQDPIRPEEARYVPEVPLRAIPVVPAFDPVAAAYQAGKINVDTERLGLDRYPRPPPTLEPRAIVSYGRTTEHECYMPRVQTRPAEPRYVDGVRYMDDLLEEEQIRREEWRRREEAEEYMERREQRDTDILERGMQRQREEQRLREAEYMERRANDDPRTDYTNPLPPPRRYEPSYNAGRDIEW